MPACQAYKCANTTGRTTKRQNVTHSIFSSLPANRGASTASAELLHVHHVVLRSSLSSSLEPSFSETLPFFSFILSIFPGNTRVHYCSSHKQILNLILKLSQIRIRLYFLNRYFHLTLLQFRNQVDTSILIVCIILKF